MDSFFVHNTKKAKYITKKEYVMNLMGNIEHDAPKWQNITEFRDI